MSKILSRSAAKIRFAFVLLAALQLAACDSAEQHAQSYYESGMRLLAAQENAKAAVEFRNALRLQANLLPAWRGLAQTEEADQHWDRLLPVLRTILDLDPKDRTTRLKLARFLVISGAAEQSLTVVNEAGGPDANDASLLALKAIIHYKLKDNDSALREAQSALKIEPDNSDALIVLAADRLASNDPNGALKLLSSDSLTQKKDLQVELFKAKILAQLKDYQLLESLLTDLAELYPKNIMLRMQLFNLYMFQQRLQEGEKELRTIAAADTKNSQYGLDLVRFLYRVKGPAAAREELVAHINAGGEIFPYQLAMAEFDYDQGKIDDSFKLLQSLGRSASPPNALKAKIMLAQLNLRQKKVDAAEKIAADILSNDGRNVDALKLRASIRLERDQLDAAISDLREALNDQPRSPDLMLMLASAYERSGSIVLADRQYADALKVSNFDANVGLSYAAFLRRRGGTDRAYDILTELAAHRPNEVPVLSALAEAKLARQDWAGAENIAATIKRIDDTGGIADQIMGMALSGEHKYDASIAVFQKAVVAAPSAAQPMFGLVDALITANRTDSAIAFLQSALKENQSNAEAYVLLGDIAFSNSTSDQAEHDFRAAIESQPKNYIGYWALSEFYRRQKKFDAALDVIRAGLKQLPDNEILHLALAGTLDMKGDYEAAISEYEPLQRQLPGSLIIANNLAYLLAEHRTDKPSLDRAQSLAASLRDSPVAQFKDTLGWAYYRQRDFKTAVPVLEVAAASLPDLAIVHYHLAMGYIGIGQKAKAAEQLKAALARAPDSDLQATIKAELKDIATQ